MVNETILGGLRVAISHKSSLKDAMQSFYNAGYSQTEVEEAAKIVHAEQTNQPVKVAEKEVVGKSLKPSTKKPVEKAGMMGRIKKMFKSSKEKKKIEKEIKEPAKKVETPQAHPDKSSEKISTEGKKPEIKKDQIKPLKQSTKVEPIEKSLSKRKLQIILLASGLIFLLIILMGIIIFRDQIF